MRQEIQVAGLTHGTTPIPLGTKIENLVFSSAISGIDPTTGHAPADPRAQVAQLFRNIEAFMRAAGGSPADIGHMTVYVASEEIRSYINEEWVAMYPDPAARPARHALVTPLRGGVVAQVELIAVLPKA
ncbi:MAG: RidA family protein [Firmicutes bacterium]|nr:RidA family protein [Bacillota bacterium]